MKKIALFITVILSFLFISCAGTKLDDGMYAKIITTKGDITLSLFYDKTPLTVANFICLSEGLMPEIKKPFYDGLKFHRVIDDFMIQGGDPQGTGRGGPGYNFPDEFHPDLNHSGPGILSMANSGPSTNGSQFFITHKDTPWLDGKHTVFGRVVSGQDVVDAIEQNDIIESVKIIRTGVSASNFDASSIFKEKQDYYQKLENEKKKAQEEEMKKLTEGAKETSSGLKYIITKQGSGPRPKQGQTVSVHYAGYLTDGSKFDSSFDRNQPIEFPIGTGRVIKGWDEGIMLLNVGTKAKLIIPSDLGYGPRGAGGVIPPNATLIFDVELLELK